MATVEIQNETQSVKKNDNSAEYKYICIKKDHFDVNMINLNYSNIKNSNYIEIIYKTPTIILDGLFIKTPKISSNAITIFYKEHNINNITIKLLLNQKEHAQFIQILRSIDEHISAYINKYSMEIDNEINNNFKSLSMFKYDQIIKYYNNKHSNININNDGEYYQIYLKSYLDKNIILDLEKKQNKNYIFTFNISNIYFSGNILLPLIKCNRCESVQ
jgi:hypothetical protein